MLVDKKVTKKIAFLARIGLTEKEEEDFSKDLSNILKWMEDLKKKGKMDGGKTSKHHLICKTFI